MARKLFFSLLFLWLAISSSAQLKVTEHLLINNGLANNYITDLTQDEKGRLWVGTESGLYCYDGSEFHGYNTANSNLNSNMINKLWISQQSGELWIGTKGNGVCVMDMSTNQIRVVGEVCQHANNIMHITGTANDNLWLVSQTSIMHWSGDSLRIVNSDTSQGFFRCVFNAGDGRLLLGRYMGGVSQLDTQTLKMTRLSQPTSQLYNVTVNDFLKDNNGRIWMATDSGLWYFTPETNKIEKFQPLQINNITGIELIDGGEIWVSSRSGLWIVDLSEWTARRIPNIREHGSPTHNVRKIFQDSYGNIWFGYMGNGIDFFSHESPQFLRLCQQSIWGIYCDEEGVWAGTTDRLLCFQGTQLVKEIPLRRKGWEGSFALSINSENDGNLIVSYFGHLLRVNKKSGAVSEIFLDNGRPITSLTFYKDRDSTLWITAPDGIYIMRNGRVFREEKLNSILSRQSIHGIRRDQQGKLWVATYENGIYLFDEQKRLLRHLDKKNGLMSNSVQHLHMDPNAGIWLSTPDGMGYIPDTNHPDKYETFGYQQGLNDSYIRAIQEDNKGNTWVSTNNGISLLRKSDSKFINFNNYDGIPTNNFTGGAVVYDGKMYFTSLDGLCFFDPEKLTLNRQLSGTQIFSVTCLANTHQQELSANTIIIPDADNTYNLSHDQNSFRIIFGQKDYAQSRQTEYQYLVKDMDKAWTNLSDNTITFRHLSSGHYTIVLRARLKGQEWNDENQTSVHVYIHPPFWKSWWAYLFYIIILVGMGWGYFSKYKHRLKLQSDLELERQKNLDEQQRNTERLQFFTNITHELRTPLTLIIGPLEELMHDNILPVKVKEKITMIHHSSEQLKSLITQLLEFRKTETHNRQLVVMLQDLALTISNIGHNFSELNTNTQLSYIIDTGDKPLMMYYDENIVTTILNNLMSNSVKYTQKGEIELSLTDDEQKAVVTVRDTGYGIPPEALPHIFDRYFQAKGTHQASGTGIGLALVKSLCELHDIDIQVLSDESHGTTFTLTFKKDNTYPNALHKENDKEKTAVEQVTDEAVVTDDHRPVILVVEDNTEIRRYIANSLSDDYQIIKASDGKIGCEKAFEHIPNLIITDIMMPVMDGTELCRRIKQDIRTSHIPVIMLTAKDTQENQKEGYEVGADSYLTKPFSMPMLRSRIVNLITSRNRLAAQLSASGSTAEPITEIDNLSKLDRQFLEDVTAFIKENIADENITMAIIGEHVQMSHSTLYRKIKALTGISGNEFIRKVRLRHSVELMINKHYNVSQAAYESGFGNIPYFRSCFKAEYGMTPTEYLKNN